MFLFPAAALIGLVVGRLRGGRLSGLSSLALCHNWLPASALGLQIGAGAVPGGGAGGRIHSAAVLLSYGVVGVWLALNVRDRASPVLRWGMFLLATGWFLNVAVIVPNRGMPVDRAAMVAIDESRASVTTGQLWKHVAASPATVMPALEDIIPIPGPLGIRSVVSVGDIVMLAGIAMTIAAAMTPRRPVAYALRQ